MFLTELKAAAIDTVAVHARRAGARVVFVRNRVVVGDEPASTTRLLACGAMAETIVTHRARGGLPYSKGLMTQSLTAIGLTPERAWALARAIEQRLEAAAVESTSRARCARCRGDGRADGGRRRSSATATGSARPLDRPLVLLLAGRPGWASPRSRRWPRTGSGSPT